MEQVLVMRPMIVLTNHVKNQPKIYLTRCQIDLEDETQNPDARETKESED